MHLRSALGFALAIAMTLAPLPVRSAPPTSPATEADDATKRLKSLYDDAHVAFLAGRFREAAGRFDSGYQQSGLAAFLFNAAVAWERAGDFDTAILRYAEYVVKNPGESDAGDTQARIEALKEALRTQKEAELAQVATKGVAVITSKPEGAEIRLDDANGALFAVTPFRGTLPPGEHTVHLRSKGYKAESKALPDTREKMLIAHFGLSEEYFLGHIEIAANASGAAVYLTRLRDADGAPVTAKSNEQEAAVGYTPFSNQVPPGTYRVRLVKEGYLDWTGEAQVVQGKVKSVSADLATIQQAIVRLTAKNEDARGAEVYVGSEEKARCVLPCELKAEVGKTSVKVRRRGFKPLTFDVRANAADLVTVAVALEPATRRTPAIVTGILTLGTAATGIAFGIRAKRTENALRDDLDANAQIDADDPRARIGKRDAIIADVMFGATALLGALTLYYLLRRTGKPSSGDLQQRSLVLAPAASPRLVGLAGEWRF